MQLTRQDSVLVVIRYHVLISKNLCGKAITSHGMSYFFFNDTATTEIYTLSLHDALPISIATLPSAVMQSYDNGGGWPWGLIPAGIMTAIG